MTRLNNEPAQSVFHDFKGSPHPNFEKVSRQKTLRPEMEVASSVDVIIPVHNQVDYTRACLESLQQSTQAPARVTVIDNGSTDDTAIYLAGVPGLNVIHNRENLGCARAWNQGVKVATGNWVLLLNNDVLLPAGWLDGLLSAALENDLDIACPAMREGPLNYQLEEYAREFVASARDFIRRGTAHGVCFLVRRRVFETIGLFDENFRYGQFEDRDFFHRARLAGFALGATGRSFVHHFGSVTQRYIQNHHPAETYVDWNRAYFRNKWSETWLQRRLDRWKVAGLVAWWRTRELRQCGHSLAERWRDGVLLFE